MTQDPGSGSPMSERMQSLLSRAVEDQLSEQRQLAGALTEMRTQLSRLGSQLESLQAGDAGGPQLDEALGAISGEVREAVRLLGERLDNLPAREDIESIVARLSESVDELGERIGRLEGRGGETPAAAGVDVDAIEEIVARAISDSERRLADHVDEAVLTLAEALLRRRSRPRPTGFAGPAVVTPQPEPEATSGAVEGEPEADDLDADDDDEDLDDAVDDEDLEDEDGDDDGADDDGDVVAGDVPTQAWQTPSPVRVEAAPALDDDEPEPGKRKPWWRPGG